MTPAAESKTMTKTKTPLETSGLPKNKAVMMTVQRITVVTSRRKKIFALEGVGAATAASGIHNKITEALAGGQLRIPPGEDQNSSMDGLPWYQAIIFKTR